MRVLHTKQADLYLSSSFPMKFSPVTQCQELFYTDLLSRCYADPVVIHSVPISHKTFYCQISQGCLLLTWFNFNPSMDKSSHAQLSVEWNTYPFPNFNGATVEVWEWISNFIPHFITYPCWDSSKTMLIKGVPGLKAARYGFGIVWSSSPISEWYDHINTVACKFCEISRQDVLPLGE